MKTMFLSLAMLCSVAVSASPVLKSIMKVNLPLTFIDNPHDIVSISEHCSIVAYEKTAVMGFYEVKVYAVGNNYVGKKLAFVSFDMKITDEAHIWCVIPAGFSMKALEKELNKE